ncbi:MAG TPA: UrcA family protein [Allosphingosinicella sp.]|jgi:UrcA family protein|nr:UrcA family protein [Allosphingosinicella sp.]
MNKLLFPAALLSALSGQAIAASASPAPSAAVSYRDLDLSTAAGQSTLEARLAAAVRQVCPRRFDGGIGLTSAEQSCRRDAFASARGQAKQAVALAHRQPVSIATR